MSYSVVKDNLEAFTDLADPKVSNLRRTAPLKFVGNCLRYFANPASNTLCWVR